MLQFELMYGHVHVQLHLRLQVIGNAYIIVSSPPHVRFDEYVLFAMLWLRVLLNL